MDKTAYHRALPTLDLDNKLFPDEASKTEKATLARHTRWDTTKGADKIHAFYIYFMNSGPVSGRTPDPDQGSVLRRSPWDCLLQLLLNPVPFR